MKITSKIVATVLFIGLFSACITDDDGSVPPEPQGIQRGDVEVNRFIISFTPKSGGGAVKSFEFYDPDGNAGNAPLINETWTLDYSTSGGNKPYDATIKFYSDSVEVTNQIEAKNTKYIVCYKGMNTNNLRLNDSDLDDDGIKLGITTSWQVLDDQGNSSNGLGNVKVTLNYIHLRKDGLCDAGVRIFESTINYQHQ